MHNSTKNLPGNGLSEIVVVEIVNRFILSCDKPTTQGRVSNNRDTKLPSRLEKSEVLIFDVEGEGRVFHLKGCNRVNCVCPTEGRGRAFTQTEIFDFTGSVSRLRVT